jgi:aspartate kinase
MKVFKFGGASVNSIERIQNVKEIIASHKDDMLVIIVSAMGKTTNALERVAESFYNNNKEESIQLFNVIRQQHLDTARLLLTTHYLSCEAVLLDVFTEVEWILQDKPVRDFDYYYDQLVCTGELMSTIIVSHYLNQEEINNTWLDVRDILRTDNTFRDAAINWETTTRLVREMFETKLNDTRMVITQGFIGCTDENESTTLGREGSDFTAAIFANILDAESQTIWKDVEGVMNADPKQFSEAQWIPELSFEEVIEMAFYGAQVIHPKTIKPLQNKSIPLLVKSFLDPTRPGTTISQKRIKDLPPIIIIKKNQALLYLNSPDFSFVGEKPVSNLYDIFLQHHIKPNLIQTGAISIQVCIDDRPDKTAQLAAAAGFQFDVQLEKELELLTIRHYNNEILTRLTAEKDIILTQQTKETVQVLYRSS